MKHVLDTPHLYPTPNWLQEAGGLFHAVVDLLRLTHVEHIWSCFDDNFVLL